MKKIINMLIAFLFFIIAMSTLNGCNNSLTDEEIEEMKESNFTTTIEYCKQNLKTSVDSISGGKYFYDDWIDYIDWGLDIDDNTADDYIKWNTNGKTNFHFRIYNDKTFSIFAKYDLFTTIRPFNNDIVMDLRQRCASQIKFKYGSEKNNVLSHESVLIYTTYVLSNQYFNYDIFDEYISSAQLDYYIDENNVVCYVKESSCLNGNIDLNKQTPNLWFKKISEICLKQIQNYLLNKINVNLFVEV